ncbi:cytochrome b/b6 domain-containing protein [Vibrio sp. Of7-15]|uniref:cytochrome b n=1 Tax=Vibrio sp. Of7-15 TaxID=2724879 RepID=UPI001EF2897D|nr:cytochrome b/b6 domain-containing protein [Vibrio sp. Of7-15]MCG7497409.1 cytochrome b/b6 domain-containing protein [Vibrio sp. Of7-15]
MNDYYDKLTRLLHWIMAVIIIYATLAGYIMHLVIESHPHLFDFLSVLNMSLATVGFFLFFIRIIWKFNRPDIHKPTPESTIQKVASKIVHVFLYAFMAIVFISGFLMLKNDYMLFWLISIPNPISDPEINDMFFIVHRVSCAGLTLLVLLHACAALHHHYVRKNNVLYRMIGPTLYS